jgi:hypothetical protein
MQETSMKQAASEVSPIAGLFLGLHLDSDVWDGTFLRNVCWISPDYTALYPRGYNSSTNQLYKSDRSRLQRDPLLEMRSTQVYRSRYCYNRQHKRTSCWCHQRKNPKGKLLGNYFVVIGNTILIYSDENLGTSETTAHIRVGGGGDIRIN